MNQPEVERVSRTRRGVSKADALRQRIGANALRVAALLALAVAPSRADTVQTIPTVTGSGVTIKVTSPAVAPPRFGFAPMLISVENGTTQERSWQFGFQVGSRGQFPGVVNLAREMTVPAGQTRDTWIFVPLAEPSTPTGRVVAPSAAGPSGSITYTGVSIIPTATGKKITRTLISPSTGLPMGTEEVEIDATNGKRSTKMTQASGASTSTNTSTSTLPSGINMTFVIDPNTGNITMRPSPGSRPVGGGILPTGPGKIDIVVSANPGLGGPGPRSNAPKVSVTQTPVGTKVTLTYNSGAATFSTEQEIDSTTGVITRTTNPPPGRPAPPPNFSPPRQPGTETTFTIDESTGNIRTNTRNLNDGSVVPKIIIVRAPAPGSPGSATLISATGMVGVPVVVGGVAPPMAISVEVTGYGINGVGRTFFGGPQNAQMRPLATTAALEPVVRGQLSVIVRGAPNLSVVTIAQLPADWRVWSSFAGVMLPADEYATLDAGHRAALRGWVGLGGRLWLVPSASGAEHVEKIGAGAITTLAEPLAAVAPSAATAITSGGTTRLAAPVIDQHAIDLWIEKIQIYNGTPGLPDRDGLVLEKTPLGEAIQERASSTTWLGVFLIAFAAIVGPVNLFVFAPPAKRYRLFYTTPLIALAAAVLLGATIILQDGRGGDGVRRALVVLLPGENQAAVFQEQVTLTGFLSRRTFPVADDTLLTMLPLDSQAQAMMFAAGNSEFTRADGRAGGDWFRNRNRQAHLVERLMPTRGRIERVGTAPDGAPIVQSSLGTALHDFVCVDDAEKFWTATEVQPGKRVTLVRGTSAIGNLVAGGSKRFGEVIEAAMPRAGGHWRARGGASDLAPIATLDSIRWEEADVLFAGVLEGKSADQLVEAKP